MSDDVKHWVHHGKHEMLTHCVLSSFIPFQLLLTAMNTRFFHAATENLRLQSTAFAAFLASCHSLNTSLCTNNGTLWPSRTGTICRYAHSDFIRKFRS